jgi:hypothetical protein
LKIYYLVSLFVLFSVQGFVWSANIGFFIMMAFSPPYIPQKRITNLKIAARPENYAI